MKLLIKKHSDKRLIMTDENGVPLPLQKAMEFKDYVAGDSTVTVTFIVDGNRVKIAD